MRTRSKLILAALTASLLMGLAVSSASANRLSTSNTRFRVTWANLDLRDVGGNIHIICPVTLEGSFHSATLRKVTGALIGAITRGIVNGSEPPCTGGTATILQESLPWHVTYEGFRGTLPAITSIELLLRRYAFRVETEVLFVRVACLYRDRGRVEENLRGTLAVGANGQVTTLTPTGGQAGLSSGGFGCPAFGTFSNAGQVFLLGNTTRISVTLI
jgi:hypothetical protein